MKSGLRQLSKLISDTRESDLRRAYQQNRAHLEADHEILQRIWRLHAKAKTLTFNGKPICLADEQIYPCETIRMYDEPNA